MRGYHAGQFEQQGKRTIERRIEAEQERARTLQQQDDTDEKRIQPCGLAEHGSRSVVSVGPIAIQFYTVAAPAGSAFSAATTAWRRRQRAGRTVAGRCAS